MFELWARNRDTKRYERLCQFNDDRQFYFMLDQVDRSKYYEAMITQDQHCLMYVEFKEPQKSLGKSKTK